MAFVLRLFIIAIIIRGPAFFRDHQLAHQKEELPCRESEVQVCFGKSASPEGGHVRSRFATFNSEQHQGAWNKQIDAASTSSEGAFSASGASTPVSTLASGSIHSTNDNGSRASSLPLQNSVSLNRITHQYTIRDRYVGDIHFPRRPTPAVLRTPPAPPSPLSLLPQTNQHMSHPTILTLQPRQPKGVLSARLLDQQRPSYQPQPQSSSPRDAARPKEALSEEENKSDVEVHQPALKQPRNRTAIDIRRPSITTETDESTRIRRYEEKNHRVDTTDEELVFESSDKVFDTAPM
ncbi:hypothetical protein BKA65DRAFT_557226 [Rhexocercosporidium sp. MPI-PUGE-AT-0058]|nr:hypothetical protein BKA65DRAFT_557226 [Rhexocercosporidium sp. MPI-PUGE-AT-0058]